MGNSISRPKITIIIALKNDREHLKRTLDSIVSEPTSVVDEVEILVVDSNSTDFPVEIIEAYKAKLKLRFNVGFDASIYAAWNKGVCLAEGEYLTFFGAGDLVAPGTLRLLVDAASVNGYDVISAKSLIVYQDGSERESGTKYVYEEFKKKFTTNHAGLLYKKSLFENFGNFNLTYRIAADYEFLLRIGSRVTTKFIDDVVSIYPYGGISSRSIKPLVEVYKIRKRLKVLGRAERVYLLMYGILAHYYRMFFPKLLKRKFS